MDAMIAALFADPGLSKLALYVPVAGVGWPVRVIARQPDVTIPFGAGQISVSTNLFDVQKAAVATPLAGDHLVVDGTSYLIQGEPALDREQLVWTLGTVPV